MWLRVIISLRHSHRKASRCLLLSHISLGCEDMSKYLKRSIQIINIQTNNNRKTVVSLISHMPELEHTYSFAVFISNSILFTIQFGICRLHLYVRLWAFESESCNSTAFISFLAETTTTMHSCFVPTIHSPNQSIVTGKSGNEFVAISAELTLVFWFTRQLQTSVIRMWLICFDENSQFSPEKGHCIDLLFRFGDWTTDARIHDDTRSRRDDCRRVRWVSSCYVFVHVWRVDKIAYSQLSFCRTFLVRTWICGTAGGEHCQPFYLNKYL